MEMGLYLANIPGIAGGRYTTVPDTFKVIDTTTKQDEMDVYMEEVAAAEAMEVQRAAAEAAAVTPNVSTTGAGSSEPRIDDFGDLTLGDDQILAPDVDPEGDEAYAELPQDSPLASGEDEQHSDLNSVRTSVEDPDSDDLGIRPGPGAAARAAQASVDPSAMVGTLPYEWDQFGMFATFKAIDTLHNDSRPYVAQMREQYPDVFEDEDPDTTMSELPQVCTRFPGLKEKTKALFPLSRGVPLRESRFCDMQTELKSARAGKELTEAVHSFAHGRAIGYNDPEVAEHEAMARGIETGFSMKGNLFARSTWQRFTLSALEARGMYTPEEAMRVKDQGLCLRLRVRNHRAVEGHAEADAGLKDCTLALPKSFTAQERRKRERGDDPEPDVERHGSHSAKRRALEVAPPSPIARSGSAAAAPQHIFSGARSPTT